MYSIGMLQISGLDDERRDGRTRWLVESISTTYDKIIDEHRNSVRLQHFGWVAMRDHLFPPKDVRMYFVVGFYQDRSPFIIDYIEEEEG